MPPQTPPQTPECKTRSHNHLTVALENPESSYHKGLPHDAAGAVIPADFEQFVEALQALNNENATAPLARVKGGALAGSRKMVNPISGWATDSQMSDPCCFKSPPPPKINSEGAAAELVELYWMAVLRDVPFVAWPSNPDVQAAIKEVSGLPLAVDPEKPNGDPDQHPYQKLKVAVNTLFRGGELDAKDGLQGAGPYISQFLYQPIPYGTLLIDQKNEVALPGINYMGSFEEWLAVQNGSPRAAKQNLAKDRRYLATLRDLATYAHFDQLYEAYLNAALILLGNGYASGPGNPYGSSCSDRGDGLSAPCSAPKHPNQEGFATFGGPHILSLVTEISTRALKAEWRQKWTHLRLRPEAYAGLFHRKLVLDQTLPALAKAEAIIKKGSILGRIIGLNGNAPGGARCGGDSILLPMAYAEGSPTHPSYGAGHAVVAGACVTLLKAFFNEKEVVRNPVMTNADGSALLPYTAADAGQLTVGYELDKLAYNIAMGRNIGGVHYRSDATQSLLLGQHVAIDMLLRQAKDYVEEFTFEFTTFGGHKVTISNTNKQGAQVPNGFLTYKGSEWNLPSDECKRVEKIQEIS
jgi:hypothetical protein